MGNPIITSVIIRIIKVEDNGAIQGFICLTEEKGGAWLKKNVKYSGIQHIPFTFHSAEHTAVFIPKRADKAFLDEHQTEYNGRPSLSPEAFAWKLAVAKRTGALLANKNVASGDCYEVTAKGGLKKIESPFTQHLPEIGW